MKTFTKILIVLFIIGLGIGFYYLVSNTKETTKKVENEQKEKVESKEILIEDKKIKKELEDKTRHLLISDYCFLDEMKYLNSCLLIKNKTTIEDLNSIYKIISLVEANKEKSIKLDTTKEITINDQKYLNINSYLDEETIKNLYFSLYDEIDSFLPNEINKIENKSVIYDEKAKKFYIIYNLQDKNETLFYNNKYTIKDNHAYVYISSAFVNFIKMHDKISNYEVYKDYKTTTLKVEGIYSEYEDFKINKENYKEYSQYKITFKKALNNNYLFEKIEMIK